MYNVEITKLYIVKFYFRRCDHHSRCKTYHILRHVYKVSPDYACLQEFRNWEKFLLKTKNIYILVSLLVTNVTSRNFCGHCL